MNINEKRRTKGITLVALVITIIVMLILAGVAINLTIDSNGLFGKANTAGNKWNSAVENERSELQEWLDILGVEEPTTISTEFPAGKEWDSNKVSVVVAQGTRTAPVPKGFTVSGIEGENTIRSGLVIYETGNEDTTAEGFWTNTSKIDGKEYLTCQTTYNQYVWIPVDDINYMVMCKNNGKIADESGNKTCNLKLIDGTLQCTNTAHSATATDLCGRLYANTEEIRANQTWNTSSYHEPNIVSSYDKDDTEETKYMLAAGITSGKVADFQKQLTDDFTAMATSVAKYGGFYVSRYEAEENGTGKKNQKVITAASSSSGNYIGVNTWYGLYRELHKEIVVGTSKIQSHMIYGSQYDQIINFLETNANNEPQIGHTGRQLKTQEKTGSNEADVMSNIYDLEGNNVEWTAQAYSTNNRSYRGGNFYDAAYSSYFYPASYRYSNIPTFTNGIYTSRASLYL